MTLQAPQDDIYRWLEIATSGLPVPIAATSQGELEDHYLAAVDAHRRVGLDIAEAQQLALAELGDAADTAESLRRAHFSSRRCFIATLVCLLYPAALFSMPLLARFLDVYQVNLFLTVSTTAIILYILYGYKSLVRTSVRPLDRPVWAVFTGQILWTLTIVLSYILFHKLPLMGPGETLYWDFTTFGAAALDIAMLVSEALTGLGALWMGVLLLRESRSALQLIRPVGWLLVLVGVISLSGSLAAIFGWSQWLLISSSLGYLAVTVTLELMAYFFLISATRSPRPMQAA